MTVSRPYATMIWEGGGGADIVDRATGHQVGHVVKMRPGQWRAYVGSWELVVGEARRRDQAAQLVWERRPRPVENVAAL